MTAARDDTTTDLHAVIAELRSERDAGLAREEELRAAQVAGLEVLQAMAASPGDTQPVFDLIARRAADLCAVPAAAVAIFDGAMLHLATQEGFDPSFARVYATQFPRPVGPDTVMGRTILSRRVEQIEDFDADPACGMARAPGPWSAMAVPLLRDAAPLGVIAVARPAIGRFPDNQVTLLKTFAEQVVIAITSAETYRALQTRTSDLQETLEYQTAVSAVLNVISRSTFDLQPVLDTLVETAARLCEADQALIVRREGELAWFGANHGFPPEYEAEVKALGVFPLDRNSPTVSHRTLIEGRPVHIHNVAAVPGYPEIPIRLGKQRTSLGVPLLREGVSIGVMLLARQRVEPFTDRQIDLVSIFADQAVIAIENTRLMTEQREALEQQTATAEVLQVINASPGNLTPVFDTILEKAMRLCDAAFGMFYAYDGTSFRTVVARGVPPAFAAFRERQPPNPSPGSPFGRAFKTRRPVHVLDWLEEPDYKEGTPGGRAIADLGGARTVLNVPLVTDAAVLGMISFYRQQVRPFSDKQIALLENFAAQAVIAMENARLITEQREALEQQTATAEVLQVINASPGNLAPVFDAMLEKAMRLCGGTIGGIFTFDGDHSVTSAVQGVTAAFQEYNDKYPMDKIQLGTVPARIIETRGPVQNPDLTAGENYHAGHPYARALVELGGIRAVLAVPLLKDGVAVGMVAIYRQEAGAFSDKQIALLESFAAQAVIAMDNARLITEQREALEQQTATAEVLEVINSSPGDLGPVFQALLRKAHTLCESSFGALMTYDGERFHAVAHQGTPAPFREFLGSGLLPGVGDPFGLMVEGAAYSHIHDLLEVVARYPDEPLPRAAADLGGIRTLLVVPLRKDSELLGVITAYRQETRPFSDRQIALLQNFAAQAVIAMENARLLTEQREALEQQTATAEVLQVINSSPGDLAPVFDAMLEKATRLCEASFGVLNTYDGKHFQTGATLHVPPPYAAYRAENPHSYGPGTFPRRILDGERLIQIVDLKAEDTYKDGDAGRRALVELGGARTCLVAALVQDERVCGFITVYRQDVCAFTDKQIALLQNFAAQAVIAMENARLLDEIRQRQAELRITFENMGDGVALFDEAPRLVAWNRHFQEMFNLPDDLLEQHRTYEEHLRFLAARGDFGSGRDAEEQLRTLLASTDKPSVYERTRPDGRVLEIRRNPVPDGGFVLIFSDITERKRSEEQIRAARDAAEAALRELKAAQANLIQAEKMASLGQLTAGIAHEIKNPLNFVNNFAELSGDLLDELNDAVAGNRQAEIDELRATLQGNLAKITEHGRRADAIVRSMLEHSRGSSGERRVVELNALIDEALNLAYHGARAQDQSFNITLERDFGVGIAPIEVNPQDITRVFLNLFANGFYAVTRRARDGDAGFVPSLKITTRDAGEAVETRVWDNGTGIPADISDKLFQPFFTTKPTGEGTGLGLSITYDIVTQQHGGSIAVESKVGAYSVFTIRLPRQP